MTKRFLEVTEGTCAVTYNFGKVTLQVEGDTPVSLDMSKREIKDMTGALLKLVIDLGSEE